MHLCNRAEPWVVVAIHDELSRDQDPRSRRVPRKKDSPPPMPDEPIPAIRRVLRSPVWKGLNGFALSLLAKCTGTEFCEGNLTEPLDFELMGRLAMFDIASSLELGVSIHCSLESGSELVRSVLSLEGDREIVSEMLSELSNNLLGCAKQMLAQADFDFVLNVPSASAPSPPNYMTTKTLVAETAAVRLIVQLGARPISSRLVNVAGASENMVLVEDVRTESGAVLVPAGTRLSGMTAEQISRRLPSQVIRVASMG